MRGKEGKMGGGEGGYEGEARWREEKEGVRGKEGKMRGGEGGCEGREDGGLCTWHSRRIPAPLFVRSSILPHSDCSLGTASAN